MSRGHRVVIAAVAGLVAGTLVLGVGGRLAMRAIAYTEPAPPRFTGLGTLQVLGAGAAWGAVTGPALLVLDGLRRVGAGIWRADRCTSSVHHSECRRIPNPVSCARSDGQLAGQTVAEA
jgi:hypothetical protein